MSDAPLARLSQRLTELFAAEEFAAGFALGRHILRYYPRFLSVYQRMGLAAQSVGLFSDSVDLLQRAVSANPEDGRAWRALHLAAVKLDMHPDAEIAEQYALDLDVAHPADSDIARGHAAAADHHWPDAYRLFRSGLEQHPERMDAALGMAQSLYHLDHFDAAQSIARYVLQELPYALKAHLLILLTTRATGQDDPVLLRHIRAVRGLDPLGELSQTWFAAPQLDAIFPARPMIPAWDETERWAYAR